MSSPDLCGLVRDLHSDSLVCIAGGISSHEMLAPISWWDKMSALLLPLLSMVTESLRKLLEKQAVMAHTFNTIIWEAEAERCLSLRSAWST